ncbi:MAG TPA: aminopeptidase P family protein [Firmicutes bacterium]|nr:aminopeptidase P family protein [Bacillota bacterium]
MEARLEKVRGLLRDKGIDAILVMQPENRRYLSGFTGSNGVLLISAEDAILITDFRYTEQAQEEAPGFKVTECDQKISETIADVARSLDIRSLGFESDFVTYRQHAALSEKLSFLDFVPYEGIVEGLRMVKDEDELAMIAQACDLGDSAFSHILGVIRPGISELDVAIELEWHMRKKGAEGIAFDVIVASGARSALPHGRASGKKLETGDFVVIDLGARFNGYCGDMTRTIVIGRATDEQRRIYGIVLDAQVAALAAVAPGKKGSEVDAVARDRIAREGYASAFGHGLGHGVGLAVHEEPRLSPSGDVVLGPGMVVSVEPGIYLPELGGVRIEDLVAVTGDGCSVFTHSDKTLIEI